jgi:prolipoprotein diacylglyceryl transferase
VVLEFIPTPASSGFSLGPLHLHYYALLIVAGIFLALFLSEHFYRKANLPTAQLYDLAIWVIPFGLVGARLYHVITSLNLYFGKAGNPLAVFYIWRGGLGIWGAVAGGVLGGFLYFKRAEKRKFNLTNEPMPGYSYGFILDLIAPGLVFAQAIGRWGNWFNGELFGKPSHNFWALQVPLALRPTGFEKYQTFTPTFLYESIWCTVVGFILFALLTRKLKANQSGSGWSRSGNIFLIYTFLYTLGRTWIESLRIDPAFHLWGVRINVWVSAVVALVSLSLLWARVRLPQKK